ncbi:protein ANTAGONIST OF LIKE HETEROCHROMATIN PROTEIN 1-like [Drosophila innubila]|uniref:protein ANTAGONIST OF LIKE HETEROCHROMATIN PROTEIN 1-like n=1 Tax=Drosophila innubila TaxID=198719 RepID=UPI00148D94C9|nr:protein ANTAGONIST OF LIKE HETEROCHROMATIN PROTEIN 1-like [Drosophila innubila]
MAKQLGWLWKKDVPKNDYHFFKESFRMERSTFDMLVSRLETLNKKDTNFKNAIPLNKRTAIALYTLGSTAEYQAVGRLFGVSPNSVCNILHEFCRAIVLEFTDEYMTPNFLTESKIDEYVQGFEAIGFPQCLGAIDGCHIEVEPPAAEATDYHNYKGWNSVVLLALVDYRDRFMFVDIGSPGGCNDSFIFQRYTLCEMIDSCQLLDSKSKEICGVNVPIFLIGDSAFRFSPKLMKPYPFSTDASLEKRTCPKQGELSRRSAS